MNRCYKQVFIISLLISISLTACHEEETQPGNGSVLVVNEGGFGKGNGSLSLYDPRTGTVNNQAFQQVNHQELSASVQSVTIYQDKAYVICNATDKIEIVNPATLERLAAPIEDSSLVAPRYMTVAGNKGYVSVWGPYGENYTLSASRVFVINLDDYSIAKKIQMDPGPEGIMAVGSKVFVANSFSNTVSVINTQRDEVDTTLTTNTSPVQWALDEDGMLWVSTTGGFGGGTPAFVQIDPATYEVKNTLSMTGTTISGKFALNARQDSLFFLGTTAGHSAVYGMSIAATAAPEHALIDGNSFYGIGIAPATNILYVGEAPSYETEGTVLRYHTNGTLIDNFPAGIAPNGFVFE